MVTEIGSKEAKKLLDSGQAVALDVREKEEIEFTSIGKHTWIPMNELAKRFAELPKGKLIIAVCRSGSRSAAATEFLSGHGYEAKNLKGGIIAWAKEVDARVKPYVYSREGEKLKVVGIG